MENRSLTILFSDMKGFTDRTSHQSRTATAEMIKRHRELLLPLIEKRGGKLIKTIGDAFLVTFESPTDAVLAGVALQETLRSHNSKAPEQERIEVRIAVNTGEVILEDGDVYGEPVNIAARIQALAEANEIYFTESTYLSMNKSEVPSAEIGYRILKGIPQRIKIYKVLREGESPPSGSAQSAPLPELLSPSTPGVRRMVWVAAAAGGVGLLVAAGLWRLRARHQAEESPTSEQAPSTPSEATAVQAPSQAELTEARVEIATHEQHLRELGQTLAQDEQHLEAWQKELSDQQAKETQLREALATLLSQLPTLEQQHVDRVNGLIAQAAGAGNEDLTERLKQALADFTQRLADWKLRLSMRERAHADWQQQLDAQAKRVEVGSQTLAQLNSSLAGFSGQLAQASAAPDAALALERLASDVGAFEGHVDELTDELQTLRNALDELAPSLDESRQELKEWDQFLEESRRPLHGA